MQGFMLTAKYSPHNSGEYARVIFVRDTDATIDAIAILLSELPGDKLDICSEYDSDYPGCSDHFAYDEHNNSVIIAVDYIRL